MHPQPLSAVYLTNGSALNEKPATGDVESGRTSDPPAESHFSTFPRTLLPTLLKTPSNSKLPASPLSPIRVLFLIAMPSPPEDHHDADAVTTPSTSSESKPSIRPLSEVQIGVETLSRRES
jgi:hypothetical protein